MFQGFPPASGCPIQWKASMRKGILLVVLFSLAACAHPPKDEKGFDEELAKKWQADDYGMRSYVMAFLKVGPTRPRTQEEANRVQAGHMANIRRLADLGKLSLAGPFLDKGALRGIFIFNVATVEEARALIATDPAIQSGQLVMELHPWYGSAAVVGIPDAHRRVRRKTF